MDQSDCSICYNYGLNYIMPKFSFYRVPSLYIPIGMKPGYAHWKFSPTHFRNGHGTHKHQHNPMFTPLFEAPPFLVGRQLCLQKLDFSSLVPMPLSAFHCFTCKAGGSARRNHTSYVVCRETSGGWGKLKDTEILSPLDTNSPQVSSKRWW